MWIYGAASDQLAKMLGDNVDGLGRVTEGNVSGGCGRSILIKNPDAKNSDWTALVMRKSRCPPWSTGCDQPHMDLMIPGFDNLIYSTANSCGDPGTGMSQEQSGICGQLDNPSTCSKCDQLPKNFQKGCQLFVDWGWTRGDPTCQYAIVETPKAFLDYTKKIQIGGPGLEPESEPLGPGGENQNPNLGPGGENQNPNLGPGGENPNPNLGPGGENPNPNLGPGGENQNPNLGPGGENPNPNLGPGGENPNPNLGPGGENQNPNLDPNNDSLGNKIGRFLAHLFNLQNHN